MWFKYYMRLNKFVAHHSHLSRRQADERIAAGAVFVDGKPAQLGAVVTTESVITLDGAPLIASDYVYLAFYKPVGYVCSRKQQGQIPTIYQLLPKKYQHLKTVGRLDRDSSGILLLTDDGDLAHRLTHPKHAKRKTYRIQVRKPLSDKDINAIRDGVPLEDGVSSLEIIPADDPTKAVVTMREGRNRQIRRTFKAIGNEVTVLHRTKFGPITIDQLQPGTYTEIKGDTLTT